MDSYLAIADHPLPNGYSFIRPVGEFHQVIPIRLSFKPGKSGRQE